MPCKKVLRMKNCVYCIFRYYCCRNLCKSFLVKYFLSDISFSVSSLPIRFQEVVILYKHFVNVFVTLPDFHKKKFKFKSCRIPGIAVQNKYAISDCKPKINESSWIKYITRKREKEEIDFLYQCTHCPVNPDIVIKEFATNLIFFW